MLSSAAAHAPSSLARCFAPCAHLHFLGAPRALSSDAAAAAAARQPPPPLPPPAPLRFDDTRAVFAGRSSLSLLHSLAVFRACTVRPLVSHAPALLAASRRVLGDGATAAVLRRTFFAHFCAGEDEAGLEPTLARLRAAGVGAI